MQIMNKEIIKINKETDNLIIYHNEEMIKLKILWKKNFKAL